MGANGGFGEGWGEGEDNALCRDNAAPYSCHLPLVGETKREERGPRCLGAVRTRVSAIGKGSWGGDGSGVQCLDGGLSLGGGGGGGGVLGGQVPQKSGSGCSTLAAHHGSSQVNVKTRESFAEY